MIKNVLTHIGGIEAYGIFSVLLFFCVFTSILAWALRLERSELESRGRLPLNDPGDDRADSNPQPSETDFRHE